MRRRMIAADRQPSCMIHRERNGVTNNEAAFTGNHGWFFRNRNNNNATMVLRTGGDYGELKKML